MSLNNTKSSYNTTIGPSESFARVPWYFANSTDAPTDLTVTASSLNLNSSLRSQRLQETLKSLDQSFVVVSQANMSQNEIMPLEGSVSFMKFYFSLICFCDYQRKYANSKIKFQFLNVNLEE